MNFIASIYPAFSRPEHYGECVCRGLKFSQGADMCSLQKPVCQGKC